MESNQKEKFVEPEAEIIELSEKDIILTSGCYCSEETFDISAQS